MTETPDLAARALAAAAQARAVADLADDLAQSHRSEVIDTGTAWDAHRAALEAIADDLAELAERAERDRNRD